MKFLTPKFGFLYILTCMSILSCAQSTKQDDAIPQTRSSVTLTVARGAFHYDRFVLRDTTLTFYPNKDAISKESTLPYTTLSTQHITSEVRDRFITHIIDQGIWDISSTHKEYSSCTSGLTITLTLNGKTKTMQCDDYKRGCPALLQYIEDEMIRLHDKGLKRIYLPG